ncbi:hypothetical protein GN956_G3457 [Arapaima gigas]
MERIPVKAGRRTATNAVETGRFLVHRGPPWSEEPVVGTRFPFDSGLKTDPGASVSESDAVRECHGNVGDGCCGKPECD